MKSLISALAFSLLFSGAVAADPAVVIKLDQVCRMQDMTGNLYIGDVHFVLNDGDLWVLSCHGKIVDGVPPRRAEVLKSSDEDPLWECLTPFGFTYNFQQVSTPSGKSKVTCWGIVDVGG
jgi:hypothetical protein